MRPATKAIGALTLAATVGVVGDAQEADAQFNPLLEDRERPVLGAMHSLEGRLQPFDRRGATIAETDNIEFNFGFHFIGRGQYLTQDDVRSFDGDEWFTPTDMGFGMQTGFGNLNWQLLIGEGDIEVFFDAFLATQRHPTRTWGHNGYIYLRSFPDDLPLAVMNPLLEHVDLKVGNFYPDFGNTVHYRTLNADAVRNSLIGNPIVSPHGVEPGAEVIHRGDRYGVMVGAGIGAPEEDFHEDRSLSLRTKAWLSPLEGTELAYSLYTVSHDEGVDRGTNLHRRERLGSSYADVWTPGFSDGGGGEGPGQVRIGDGVELTTHQVDAHWDVTDRTFVNGHFGYIDATESGYQTALTGDEEWLYYGADVTQYLGESVYLAGRYSAANARELDYSASDPDVLAVDPANAVTDGTIDRWQLGFGIWVTDRMLVKTEFVRQAASGFDALEVDATGEAGLQGISGQTDVSLDPTFDGLIFELSYAF